MNARTATKRMLTILAVGAIGLAFTVRISAQVQTSSTTEHKAASHEVKVEHAEVLMVDGNDLVLKMEDGSIRHLADVPESTKATVDGREVGIHQLKPGMHLSKTVTTVTTPKVITTTQTVTGKVWHVSPPNSVILTLDDGTNQSFKIPKGQKFTVNGQETDAFGLKKGMKVSATKVVEEPITVVEQQAKLTGRMPPPPPPPAVDQPILIAVVVPAAPAAAPEAAPAALPKTGSNLPLIGLLGLLLLAGSGLVKLFQTARH
jgi:LPXTG-motif cell wall-anchored protein